MISVIPKGGRRGAGRGDPTSGSEFGKVFIMNKFTKLALVPAVLGVSILPAAAQAAGTGTVADLAAAVDFSDTKTAVIAVAVALMGVSVLIFGVWKVYRMVGK